MNTPIRVHYLGTGEASEIGELLECIWSNGSQGHRAEGEAAVRLYSKKEPLSPYLYSGRASKQNLPVKCSCSHEECQKRACIHEINNQGERNVDVVAG